MKHLISIFLILVSGFAANAIQDMEVEVLYQNFNSSNKVIIDQEEIRNSHAPNLPTLLATQANISIASSGFQPNSIYLRGGDASHVLILIDGIVSYDASTPQRTVNLSNLNLRSIKRIEIMKGSQSVLYGGQAFSGVIKIETFPVTIQKQGSALIQGGVKNIEGIVDYLTPLNQQLAFSGSARVLDAQNPSPVKDSKHVYPRKNIATDLVLLHKAEIENIFKVSYSDDKNQFANSDRATNRVFDTDNFVAGTEVFSSAWIIRKKDVASLSVSQQNTRRLYIQDQASALATDVSGEATDEDYRGQLTTLRLDVKPYVTEHFWVDAGFSATNESLEYYKTAVPQYNYGESYNGIFLKLNNKVGNFLTEAGARVESGTTTYQVGVTWNDILKIEHSTGFKIPSLFQLYSASYGNPNLRPETAKNISVALEGHLTDHFYSSVTVFDTQFENLIIATGPPYRYNNISATRTQGAEFYAAYRNPLLGMRYSVSLGYQEPKDLSTGKWLARRPLRTASFKASQTFFDQLTFSGEVVHSGDRIDMGPGSNVTIEPYTILNLVTDYSINDQYSVFARIDNVFDKKYETTYGYYNPGFVAKVGGVLNF